MAFQQYFFRSDRPTSSRDIVVMKFADRFFGVDGTLYCFASGFGRDSNYGKICFITQIGGMELVYVLNTFKETHVCEWVHRARVCLADVCAHLHCRIQLQTPETVTGEPGEMKEKEGEMKDLESSNFDVTAILVIEYWVAFFFFFFCYLICLLEGNQPLFRFLGSPPWLRREESSMREGEMLRKRWGWIIVLLKDWRKLY